MTQRTRPSVFAHHVAELRVGLFYIGDERRRVLPRIAFLRRHASRPQQAVAIDAAVVIVRELAVAD